MPDVVLTRMAARDLEDLIRTHSLPTETQRRVQRSLEILREFPEVGVGLRLRWEGYRFLIGPWRWMIIVYRYDDERDAAIVMRIFDGRSGSSPTGGSPSN